MGVFVLVRNLITPSKDKTVNNEKFHLQETPRLDLFMQRLRNEELGVAPLCSAHFNVHAVVILHEHW